MAVITISRQFGSGGDEIAARVCEALGYRYFDKAMIARVASEVGLAEGEIIDFSEDQYKMQGFLDRLFNRPRVVAQTGIFAQDRTGAVTKEVQVLDEAYSISLVRGAVWAAYERGNVVIVGRGGQAILKEMPDVLHVRVQASLDSRVKRLHNRANYNWGGAQDAALKHDRASAEYLQRFYNINWDDPMLYDLVINTGKLGIEAAAGLIVAAVKHLPAPEKSD